MMNTKIVVTGGSGMVGQALKKIMPNAIYLSSKDCDLTDLNQTILMIKKYEPDTIIHIAAKVGGIIENLKYPVEFLEENIYINTNLCKAAHICNVKNFMAVLSTCIYPEKAIKYPMTEEQLYDGPPPKQNFSYAYAKRCLAVQIDSYKFQYNKSNWCYVIPCNLYGEDDKFDFERAHFVSALIEKIFNSNGEIKLLGTGASLRQFMYAGDLALAIKKLVEKNIYDNFNIANDEILSIKDIALLSLKTLNKEDIKITFSGNKEEDGNYRKDVSSKKLLEVLDNFTFTPLSKGIKKVYKIYRERNE